MGFSARQNDRTWRATAWLLSGALASGTLLGCGGAPRQAPGPPVDESGFRQTQRQPEERRGMSTGQKVVLLAGAAAAYYLYNKHKNNQGVGARGKYYRSEKNGRIYYRDEQGRAHYVTPPRGGIRVPESEARQYGLDRYSGYDGRRDGEDPGNYREYFDAGSDGDGRRGAPPGPRSRNF
jgi:hypothetical protein